MFTKRIIKVFLIAIVAFAFASVATAHAAANTVDPSYAGDGANTISGFTVTNVHYSLNASDPGNIDSVAFTTNVAVPTGSTISIKLVASGSTWYTCTGQGSTSITCNTTVGTQATVLGADQLRIVIAN